MLDATRTTDKGVPLWSDAVSTEDQYLVMGCRDGQCVRLERTGALSAQRAVRRLRHLGWAVTVLVRLGDEPTTPPATLS